MALENPSEKKSKVAALLRAAGRFVAGNVALGGLLLPMEGVMPSLTDEPWHRGLATAFSELKDRYDTTSASGEPNPTMADGDVAAVVGRLHQLLRSYLAELQIQPCGVADPIGRLRISRKRCHDRRRNEVCGHPDCLGSAGHTRPGRSRHRDRRSGRSGRYVFQFSGEHDRDAEAVLLRQAAEMLLEHAETTRNRPDLRRPHPPE